MAEAPTKLAQSQQLDNAFLGNQIAWVVNPGFTNPRQTAWPLATRFVMIGEK